MKYSSKALKLIKIGNKKIETFHHLAMLADSGLHQQVFNLLLELTKEQPKDDLHILDIACGNGAFLARLRQHGFQHLHGCDFQQVDDKIENLFHFTQLDINSAKYEDYCNSHKERFDIIISLETLEHLENPWRFLRGLKKMLKPRGYIVLSTPNIESPWSKQQFLFKNTFFQFSHHDLSYGHINPMTEFEILHMAKTMDLTCEQIVGAGEYPIFWIPRNAGEISLFKVRWSLFHFFALPFSKKVNLSWCKVYVLRKNNTE